MADEDVPEHVIDITRHGGTENLAGPIPPPPIGGNFALDENVIRGTLILLEPHCDIASIPHRQLVD